MRFQKTLCHFVLVQKVILFTLSSGLLTEVQCQSKRLRKGGKSRGQEEEENTESRRVSSTSRLPGQVRHTCARLDTFLTSEFEVQDYCATWAKQIQHSSKSSHKTQYTGTTLTAPVWVNYTNDYMVC